MQQWTNMDKIEIWQYVVVTIASYDEWWFDDEYIAGGDDDGGNGDASKDGI